MLCAISALFDILPHGRLADRERTRTPAAGSILFLLDGKTESSNLTAARRFERTIDFFGNAQTLQPGRDFSPSVWVSWLAVESPDAQAGDARREVNCRGAIARFQGLSPMRCRRMPRSRRTASMKDNLLPDGLVAMLTAWSAPHRSAQRCSGAGRSHLTAPCISRLAGAARRSSARRWPQP